MRQTRKIKLSGDLGLLDADGIREQLLDALGSSRALRIDTAALTAIDMSVLQVLIAAQKLARSRSCQFQVDAVAGGPLQQAMSRAGLTGPLASPLDINWQTKDPVS